MALIVALFVLDAMRADYFTRYASVMPTLTRLRSEGAWFSEAHVTNLPTVTGVGHATIGTGTDPRIHGILVQLPLDVGGVGAFGADRHPGRRAREPHDLALDGRQPLELKRNLRQARRRPGGDHRYAGRRRR